MGIDVKGAVASGHQLTTEAAFEVLKKGGNAFDAAVAAGFASTVTEPCLSSLGGGGFLLAHLAEGDRDVLFDFFVDAPGKDAPSGKKPVLTPFEVKFKSSVQVFHTGMGSVAVPGKLKGLIYCHRELCSLDMDDIIRPVLRYLDEGVELSELQCYLIKILMPILTATAYGEELFRGKDGGGRFYNPLLKEFLTRGSPDDWLGAFYGDGAEELEEQLHPGGGLVTAKDLREYEVREREPLSCFYRGYEILTNPPPSFGGTLLAKAFSHMAEREVDVMDEVEVRMLLVACMESMNRMRQGAGGTTHLSVVDGMGNAASMTSSNGSNSGYFFGNTGIMLNNMMGEDDLFPNGFFTLEPGTRVGSMMSPSLVKKGNKVHAVLGSGGSKRIRTAMFQVIHNLLDRMMGAEGAVEAPRMHLDDEGVLQAEPGFGEDIIRALEEKYTLNLWREKELYFGGVHTVMGDLTGWGDSRRGGHFMAVE